MSINIHSEEDVKLKIIIPYLEELGFIKEELDYETNANGPAEWLTGAFKIKEEIAKAYVEGMRPLMGKVRFVHVSGDNSGMKRQKFLGYRCRPCIT